MIVPGIHLQPVLMFAIKARSLSWIVAAERFSARVGSGLTRKHFNMLERPARDKHSNL
jgi:hypothetical protein